MTSHYTVVQYVPNPIADERINIGVITYDQTVVRARFIGQWGRVQRFGGEDVTFLKDFVRRIEESLKDADRFLQIGAPLVPREIARMISGWINSIQLTPARSSLRSTAELLIEAVDLFLVEPRRSRKAYRDREDARAVARRAIRQAAADRGIHGELAEKLTRSRPIEGQLDRHTFDAVVFNGLPYLAAQGISFEVPDIASLRRHISATAWAVDDVHKRNPDLPIAVVGLLPTDLSPTYPQSLEAHQRAKRVFEGLDAALVVEDDLVAWAVPYIDEFNDRSPQGRL